MAPITFGSNLTNSKEQPTSESYDRYHYPEYYDYYNADEIPSFIEQPNNYISTDDRVIESIVNIPEKSIQPLDGPMDSPWPMYCHDVRHTGRSPYSTVDTWDEIWRFKQHVNDFVRGSPAICEDGTIYFGGADFYALYPNGTLKWKYNIPSGYVWSAPAIDENGNIYIGTVQGSPNYLYAIHHNGTLRWKYKTDNHIYSSPAIGNDGIIYFGSQDKYIYALYPNGTLKWKYKTGIAVLSSPAIGDDGTIYCGSHDENLYALFPNNGTVKWKYKTGHWVRVSPCIADDGTIYVVSLDSYLHAVNPDGTHKWSTDVGAGTSPTIGQDGTIYAGYTKLHAINPTNGSVKWILNAGGKIKGATPCNSINGFIYFGTEIGDYGGGDIVAVNPDGTERWRKRIANKYVDSAPAISEDGTIYVGSSSSEGGYSLGYLHAFGIGDLEIDANGPYYGLIDMPVQFEGYSRGGYSPHSYDWSFGDGESSDEQNPTHTYTNPGNYTVVLTVTDNESNTAVDSTYAWIQDGNTPPDAPDIDGPANGAAGTSYAYTFKAIDPEGTIVWYYVEWGDGTNTGWIGPYSSGVTITKSHKWSEEGTYTIKCKAKDPYNGEGLWSELVVTMPRNKAVSSSLLLWFLERYPLLNRFLTLLIK